MTDSSNTQISVPQAPQQEFSILRVFQEDASFEFPGGLDLAQGKQENYTLGLNVNVTTKNLGATARAAQVRAALEGTDAAGRKRFVVEVTYTGVFHVAGFAPETEAELLNISCPAIIYPYLRAAVSDALSRGQLPPFFLPEINWPALYAASKQQGAPIVEEGPKLLH
jgi:preprotein translocase subunit SecB